MGPKALFDFLIEYGIKSVGLNAVRPTNIPHARPATPIDGYVNPVRMTDFLCGLYDQWHDYADPSIYIRELAEIQRSLSGEHPKVCLWSGGCVGNYFKVEPDGDVAFCGRFLGDENYELGNILENSFAAYRNSPKLLSISRNEARALASMKACPEFGICNGWCPHERYLSLRHSRTHSESCCGLRNLITHMKGRLTAAEADNGYRDSRAN